MSARNDLVASTRSWLRRARRIARRRAAGPRRSSRTCCADAQERGLIDADVLRMLEGGARGLRDPGARRDGAALADGGRAARRSAGAILPVVIESGHSRFPGRRRGSRRGRRHPARQGPAAVLRARRPRRLRHPRVRATGGVHSRGKRLNVLLKEFRVSHNHMAIVVDEYGGVSGLLTIEDVLEQIVGDIGDEYDVDEDREHPQGRRAHVRGAASRASTSSTSAFGTRFSDDECDTIGGLVLHELGRMPRRGEAVEIGGLELKVCAQTGAASRRCASTTPRDIELKAEW